MAGCREAKVSTGIETDVQPSRQTIRVLVFEVRRRRFSRVFGKHTKGLRRRCGHATLRVTSADAANGVPDTLDAFIIPGGGGRAVAKPRGAESPADSRFRAANGGAFWGFARVLTFCRTRPACLYGWVVEQHDIEHDNRAHACYVTLSALWQRAFPEVARQDTIRIVYYTPCL